MVVKKVVLRRKLSSAVEAQARQEQARIARLAKEEAQAKARAKADRMFNSAAAYALAYGASSRTLQRLAQETADEINRQVLAELTTGPSVRVVDGHHRARAMAQVHDSVVLGPGTLRMGNGPAVPVSDVVISISTPQRDPESEQYFRSLRSRPTSEFSFMEMDFSEIETRIAAGAVRLDSATGVIDASVSSAPKKKKKAQWKTERQRYQNKKRGY